MSLSTSHRTCAWHPTMLLLSYMYIMSARMRSSPMHVRAVQVLNVAESALELLLQGLITLYVGDIHSEPLLMVIACLADPLVLHLQHTTLSILAPHLQEVWFCSHPSKNKSQA